MNTLYKIAFSLLPLTLISSGCSAPQNPVAYTHLTGFEPRYQSSTVAKRFEESSSEKSNVKSIIELSEKYAKLSKETASLKQNNQQLGSENEGLKENVLTLEAKLTTANTELNQANKLLMEMVVELNNWKANIIGFREEIRAAEITQLKALLDILKALGGQADTQSDQAKTTIQKPDIPGQTNPNTALAKYNINNEKNDILKLLAIGEPNE
jgi:chromosome segregation ATPase